MACSGSCTWVYTPTGWIVTGSTCVSPCGCSSRASFPAGTAFYSVNIPVHPVPYDAFAREVTKMLADPALPAHFRWQATLTTTTPPPVGTVYYMPCVT
jgi:hypothetical protein